MHRWRIVGVGCLLLSLAGIPLTPPSAELRLVASDLSGPVHAAFLPGDDRVLHVAERRPADGEGAARVLAVDVPSGRVDPTPLIELAAGDDVLGFCIDPDVGDVYLCTTGADGSRAAVVARYALHGGVADQASRTPVLTLREGSAGGAAPVRCLGFGPDGMLYVALAGSGRVQPGARAADSAGRVTGRILRVDVRGAGPSGERFDVADASNRYNVPVDNPFVGRRDADPLLFVSPLQDPSGMAWDRETGDLWISDGGGERGEQIQRVVVAQRLAEPVVDELDTGSQVLAMERPGRSLDTQLESVYVLPRPGGQPESANAAGVSFEGMAVVGGTVYRGDIPNWRGRYLFGDAGAEGRPGRLWSFRHREGEVTELLDHSALLRGDDGTRLDRLASFVEDGRGELYLLDEDGEVFQLAPSAHGVMAWAPGLLGLVGVMLMLRSPRRRED